MLIHCYSSYPITVTSLFHHYSLLMCCCICRRVKWFQRMRSCLDTFNVLSNENLLFLTGELNPMIGRNSRQTKSCFCFLLSSCVMTEGEDGQAIAIKHWLLLPNGAKINKKRPTWSRNIVKQTKTHRYRTQWRSWLLR